MFRFQHGAILVELMIAMLLASILLSAITTLAATTQQSGLRTLALNSDANALLRFKLGLLQLKALSQGPCPDQSLNQIEVAHHGLTIDHFSPDSFTVDIVGSALNSDSFREALVDEPVHLWLYSPDCSVSIPLTYNYGSVFDSQSFIDHLTDSGMSQVSVSLPTQLISSLADTANLRILIATQSRFENRTVSGCRHLYFKLSTENAHSWLKNFSLMPNGAGLLLQAGCTGERRYQLGSL